MKRNLVMGIASILVVTGLIGSLIMLNKGTAAERVSTNVVAKTPTETTTVAEKTVNAGGVSVSVVPAVKINNVIYHVGDTMSIGSTTGVYTGLVEGSLALFQWITDSKTASNTMYVYADASSKGVSEWKSAYGIPYACRNLSSAETDLVPVSVLTKTNWYWLSDTHEEYTAWAFISQYKETHSIYRKDIGGVSPCAKVPID